MDELNKLPYIYQKEISKRNIEKINEITDNIFDFIIEGKINDLILKTSKNSWTFSKIHKITDSIKKTNFIEQKTIVNTDILFGYGMTNKGMNEVNSKYDEIYKLFNVKSKFNLELTDKANDTLKSALDSLAKEFNSNKEFYLKHIVLFLVFSKKEIPVNGFVQKINLHISKYYPFFRANYDEIKRVLNVLIEKGYLFVYDKLFYFPTNIFYNSNIGSSEKNSFRHYLKFDFIHKDIIEKRLNGMTLDEIANLSGISRQSIDQKQKSLDILEDSKEVYVYKKIFEKYKFNLETFKNIFFETEDTYNFLMLMCKSGKKQLNLEAFITDDSFNKGEFKEIDLSCLKPKKIKKTRKKLVEEFLEKHSEKTYKPEGFISDFNKFCSEEDKIVNVRSIDGKLTTSNKIINGYKKSFRFYDIDNNEKYIYPIRNIINGYKDGFYSAFKIFSENRELMDEMDIKNEYELHNYIRKLSSKIPNIKMQKSPAFSKNCDDRKEFFINQMEDFYGHKVEDFVNYISQTFGMKRNTFRAYIDSDLRDFVYDDHIVNNEIDFKNDFIDDIKKITSDKKLLSEDYVKNLLLSNEYKCTPEILKYLNLKKTGDVYFSNKYNGLGGSIKDIIKNDEYYDYENTINESEAAKIALTNLRNDFKVFKISDDEMVTIEFLNNKGFTIEDIKDFSAKVKRVASDFKFFSIDVIYDELTGNKLFDYGFEEVFYDEIITFSEGIKTIKKGFNDNFRIFSLGESELGDLFEYELHLLGDYEEIDNFKSIIDKKYGTNFTLNLIKNKCNLYDSDLNMVFNKKQYYLDYLKRGY